MLDTQSLELAYEKCLHQSDEIYKLEHARNLRVQIAILENDNDDLHAQIADDGHRLDAFASHGEIVQSQLDLVEASLESAQGELRIKCREIETLKVSVMVSTDMINQI